MNAPCKVNLNEPDKPVRCFLFKRLSLLFLLLIFAGPVLFAGTDEIGALYRKLIPTEKHLDPAWVKSLFDRGKASIVTGRKSLLHIGMPVGGFFTGTVYLGGDGRLWLWNIFNKIQKGLLPRTIKYKGRSIDPGSGANYISPSKPVFPFENNFAIRVGNKNQAGSKNPIRFLDVNGFKHVAFKGQYPVGEITYSDKDCPVTVKLKAYSPFIPLNADDSSLPAIVMSYTLYNKSEETVTARIRGVFENAVCLYSRDSASGFARNRVVSGPAFKGIEFSVRPNLQKDEAARKDIIFDDFEKASYDGWKVEGDAFGPGPVLIKNIPSYQGDVGGLGQRVVNSHAQAPGVTVGDKDGRTGTLTSLPFTIQRKYIRFLIGGGSHKGRTCINLLIDGKIVATSAGKNNNHMSTAFFKTGNLQGKRAMLQIVDNEKGPWGNIGIDNIVFTDKPQGRVDLDKLPDYGSMALVMPGDSDGGFASPLAGDDGFSESADKIAERPLGKKLLGALGRKISLKPGAKKTVTFLITWYFPNLSIAGMKNVGRYYASKFDSALDVAKYVASNFKNLSGATELWRTTWYDSTLPFWFLDRTMANTSTLATETCYRFKNGRFWAWEGVGCCYGTCTHVWHYAQTLGRLFPEIARDERERVDFGLAFHSDGGIGNRAKYNSSKPAHDGQCGRILGAYREFQMSADNKFLKRNWVNIKKAIEYMIRLDGNDDGIVEGAQPNTLDASWYGKVPFLASLYLAALHAGEKMAAEMGDEKFAARCKKIADRGAESFLEMFNGEYFIQLEDPKHLNAIGTGKGCYIDQVFGQQWAFQVGLGRLFDGEKTRSALNALWKYNFVTDVGAFREQFKLGRWYAADGDKGLIMCSWPKGGLSGKWKGHWQFGYFNECMTGFEWEVASHMIWEGMVKEGLAVSRAIHDRYNARKRNPYNEIECCDHYARAMASFGAYIAACGYEYNGPHGFLSFSPRLTPRDFKCAFTSARGWGSFTQNIKPGKLYAEIDLKWGQLNLRVLELKVPEGENPSKVAVTIDGQLVPAEMKIKSRRIQIIFSRDVILRAGQALTFNVGEK